MGFGVPGGFGGGGGNSPFGRAQGHVNDYHAMKSTSGGNGFSGGGSWKNYNKNNNNKNKDEEPLTRAEYFNRRKALEQCARSYQITIIILWCIDLVLMMACSDSGYWIAILLGIGIFFTWACGKEIHKCSSDIRLLELVYQTQQSNKDNKDAEPKIDQ